jgi:phosphoglycolate phosphatase
MLDMADDIGPALLLWDVDHTLIENGGVSKENYALAFEILTGRAPEAQPQTDGRT